MGKASEIVVKGVKAMLDALATVVNDSCLIPAGVVEEKELVEKIDQQCDVCVLFSINLFLLLLVLLLPSTV